MKRAAKHSAQQLKCNFANNNMLLALFALGCIISNGGAENKICKSKSRLLSACATLQNFLPKKAGSGQNNLFFHSLPPKQPFKAVSERLFGSPAWMDLSCVEQKHPGLTLQLINKP